MERVLHVVEVADLQVPVDRVELLGGEHHVLHLGPTHPFDPDVELAAGQGLGHDAHERPAGQEADVDLDDDAQHVLAVEEDRPGVGEGELAGRDRRQGCAGIHDERVPPDAGEDPHAAARTALVVVDAERHLFPARCHAGPVLLVVRLVRALPVTCSGVPKTQSSTTSSSPGTNVQPASPLVGGVRARSRKR